MPKTLRSFLTPVRVSILITLGILLVQVWTLAPSPQNPDGAELVAMVEQGRGVLHPPGFPLQAWASLAIGKLHLGSVAIRLSMLSFLFHGLTLLLLAELLRLWGFARSHAWSALRSMRFFHRLGRWVLNLKSTR